MKVYEIVKRVMLEEAGKANGYADQYLKRLTEGHPEAEVSAMLSRRSMANAKALRMVIEEMPVELAGKEVEI
jgi:hypothetical protein